MKSVKTLSDAHRLALDRGASLTIAGKTFNASGERSTKRPPAKPTAEQSPISAPGLTHDEVQRLLAARDEVWNAEMKRLAETFSAGLSAVRSTATAPGVRAWDFTVTYANNGEISNIRAEASG